MFLNELFLGRENAMDTRTIGLIGLISNIYDGRGAQKFALTQRTLDLLTTGAKRMN